MPIMSGTLGPYTSASSSPVLWPSAASEIARFTETVVLPTPPFPEPTAIRFFTPGIGTLGSCCAGWLAVIDSIVALFVVLAAESAPALYCGARDHPGVGRARPGRALDLVRFRL